MIASPAVFLSYCSQDADAARRIAEALQAAGLEVWFDQDALRGGDAWDASIRKQIRECSLFLPVVSANTDARAEGYFRLEWKLAVDRSHLMADDQPFLLPVAIDGTPEAAARVPDRFREVQWSRPFGPDTLAAFAERVLRLISGGAGPPATARIATPAASPRGAPSIAVLPFVNMSRDEENEYFADGLSEELLNVLARIKGLRVAPRTSAFYFKGKSIDVPTIAQKLNVATILEGAVRKSGKRVRITAQLVDVASQSHLWSQTYDRELDDIFAVQDDIARSVVTELRAALLGEGGGGASATAKAEVQVAASGRGGDPEAYRLYLQGRYFRERSTRDDVRKAEGLVRHAIEIDPDFALGWSELARIIQQQSGYGWVPVEEGVHEARAAAQRALDLAPDLPEAHAAMGIICYAYDWNWEEALARFKRACELAPSNADVLRMYGNVMGSLGRQEEGLARIRSAARMDPLSFPIWRFLGLRAMAAGHLDEAEAALRTALEINPAGGVANAYLAIVKARRHQAREAIDYAEQEPMPEFKLLARAIAYHALGDGAESGRALGELIEHHGKVAGYQIAQACAWRGEVDRAFEWLDRAHAERDAGLASIYVDPLFAALRGDTRWAAFMEKMGLSSASELAAT